jgi:mono/diheme cytochrome c family protein
MKRTDRRTIMITRKSVSRVITGGVVGGALFAFAFAAPEAAPAEAKPNAEKAARGAYLVKAVGCNDCHTPFKMGANGPEPDMTRMLSGHPAALVMPPAPSLPPGPWIGAVGATMTAWAGPWGTSFTANLTPDKETGLGAWTPRNFVETIRNARHLGRGRALLPPMPAAALANFTDEDLESIFAYLQSIPAIKNRVPQPLPPNAALSVAKP